MQMTDAVSCGMRWAVATCTRTQPLLSSGSRRAGKVFSDSDPEEDAAGVDSADENVFS